MPKKIEPLEAAAIERKPIPSDGFRDFPDGKGLRLRVWATGARTWMFRYSVKATGKTRLMKLGTYPELGLSDARKRVERYRVAIADGADPLGEQRQERAEAQADADDTLGDLIDLYLRDHAEKRLAPRTVQAYTGYLTGDEIGKMRAMPAPDVTAFDVAAWLDTYEKRGALTACNRAQSALSAVYSWAAPRRRLGVITNPVRGLPRRHSERGGEKRWLTDDEIGTVLRKINEILTDERPTVPQWAADAIYVTLATGQRPGEVVAMRWDHLTLPDADAEDQHGKWSMPKGFRKKVRGQRVAPPHDVPLAPQVVARLRAIPDKRGYVFPAKGGHKSSTDVNQRIARGLLPHVDVEPFTPHDLRRTCRTHLGRMDAPQHIAKKILGHVDSSVDAIYDRGAYWPQRTAALDAWAERLREIVNV